MKKLLIAAVVAAISSGAFAADVKPYIEGQLGYANLRDVDTETVSDTIGNVQVSGALKLKYDSDTTYGFEFGAKNVGIENLRLGASFSHAEFDFKSAGLTGTLSSDAGSTSISGSASRSQLGSYASSLDAKVKLYMLNAYYDFKNSTALTPFVGAGIGFADVRNTKDNEFSYSLNAGGRYSINDNLYLGLKGSYIRVNGPTIQVDGGDYGLKDIDLWKAEALLGYQF
jgi:opacity protein-like surface antigen